MIVVGRAGEIPSENVMLRDVGAVSENPSDPKFLMLYKFISISPANFVNDVDGLYKMDVPAATPLLLKMIC
jgi:hypothetical protein